MSYYDDKRISQSAIKCYLLCPNLWRAQYVDKTHIPEETEAMIFGKAVDCLVTEPDGVFDKQFDVIARGKKRLDGLVVDGKYQFKEADFIKAVLFKHKIASMPVMEMFSNSRHQVELYTETCKAKLDYLNIVGKTAIIADLKTTTDTDKLYLAMYDYQYYLQLCFYGMLIRELYPQVKRVQSYIIAIDKTPQSKFAVYKIDPKKIKAEEHTIKTVMAAMATGKRLTKGPCYACPPSIGCAYAKFTKKDIKQI